MPRVRSSTARNAHRALGAAAAAWAEQQSQQSLQHYGFQHGIAHLLACEEPHRGEALLTDFAYSMARLQALSGPGAADLGRDAEAVLSAGELAQPDSFRLWEEFLRTHVHLLARGDANWRASQILLQLAAEHADDSPVTHAAEAWLAKGNGDWLWLRRVRRPEKAAAGLCLRVLAGHDEMLGVDGALVLQDGCILSWGDLTLRVWDRSSSAAIITCTGHIGTVEGALILSDGRLLSWGDLTLRIWDLETGKEVVQLKGHPTGVEGAKELPEGQIVSWGRSLMRTGRDEWTRDHTLRVWRLDTPAAYAILEGHQDGILGAEPVSDTRVLSWSSDNTLRIWNTDTGACITTVRLPGQSSQTRYSVEVVVLTDNRVLAWSGTDDHALHIWCLETGEALARLEGHAKPVKGARELSDGRVLTWGYDGMRVWDGASGACVAVLPSENGGGPTLLASGHVLWLSEQIHIWDLESYECVTSYENPGFGGKTLELSDGCILSWGEISFGASPLAVWDPSTGERILTLHGHTDRVMGAQELSDGLLVSWSGDGTLRLWDTDLEPDEAVVTEDQHTGRIDDVEVLPDGRVVSSAMDGTLRLWDPSTGAHLLCLEGHKRPVGGALLYADERLVSWSREEDELCTWDLTSGTCLAHHENVLEWTEDRVVTCNDLDLAVWDLRTGAHRSTLHGHTDRVDGALVLPQGSVVSWSVDGTLRTWNPDTGACVSVLPGHTEIIRDVDCLPDGRVFSWSYDGTVRLWDPLGGRCLATFSHWSEISTALALSNGLIMSRSISQDQRPPTLWLWDPDARELVTMFPSANWAELLPDQRLICWTLDGNLQIWDPESEACVTSDAQHDDGVHGIDLLPDGRLVSWSRDGTLRLWHPGTARCLATLKGHTSWVMGVLARPDGLLLSWSEDSELRLWNPDTAEALGTWSADVDPYAVPDLWAAVNRAIHQGDLSQGIVTGSDSDGRNAHLCFSTVATATWHEEGMWIATRLLPTGVLIVRCWDALVFLQLHHGGRHVTLDEAAAMLGIAPTSGEH